MKKIYSFFTAIFLLAALCNLLAQEMIVGGDMESADDWIIIDVSDGAGEDVLEHEFGYMADGPSNGVDGCFHSVGTSDDGFNQFLYQEIILEKGVEYICNLAFKNTLDFNGSWNEIFIGEVEPAEGVDYTPETPATVLGGWKWSDWEAGCSDINDGTLTENDCLNQSDTVYFEGTGEVTVYLGFKFGMGWATPPYQYELMIDEFSLMGPENPDKLEFAGIKSSSNIYPNPATDQIRISNVRAGEIQIFDIAGKNVFSTKSVSDEISIDIGELSKGIYFVKTGDATTLFIKE